MSPRFEKQASSHFQSLCLESSTDEALAGLFANLRVSERTSAVGKVNRDKEETEKNPYEGCVNKPCATEIAKVRIKKVKTNKPLAEIVIYLVLCCVGLLIIILSEVTVIFPYHGIL
jgi:hypothetical protein